MLSQNMKNCAMYFETLKMGLKDGEQVMLSASAVNQIITIFDQASKDATALEGRAVPLSRQVLDTGNGNIVHFPRKSTNGGDYDLVS